MNEAMKTEYDLTIVRHFDAPRDLVFEFWTNPAHTINWMGPRGCPAVLFEQDVRVGGKWRGCLRASPGTEEPGEDLWQGGEYLEIDPPEKLVFTFAWDAGPERVVTVILTETGDGRTRMVFHQTGFNTESTRDGHGEGWNSAFDRLVDLIVEPIIQAQFGSGVGKRISGVEADIREAERRQNESQNADGSGTAGTGR